MVPVLFMNRRREQAREDAAGASVAETGTNSGKCACSQNRRLCSTGTFLMFRLMIGCIGASFVIRQYHTSVMLAPNCVGTANATTAG
jgi:hypothetical protein